MSRVRVEESPARLQAHTTLTNLARKVNSLRLDEFGLKQLSDFGINIDLITLNETSQDSSDSNKPSYFAPFPDHSVREPNDDDLGEAFNGVDDETELDKPFTRPVDRACAMDWRLSSYITHYIIEANDGNYEMPSWTNEDVGETAFEYSGLYKYEQPAFGCYHIAELKDPAYPHVKSIMYNNMVASDSAILYGELIPILRIMLTRLWRLKFIHQTVSPVLVFSLMGYQARVIEAFFHDHKLVLRPTRVYDFTHGNHNAFNTFAPWYLGKPIEITTAS